MEDQARFRITPRLIFGLLVLCLGSLLLLDQFRVLDADDYVLYWPAGLVLLGLVKLIQPGSRGGGIVLTLLGSGLLLHNLGYVEVDPGFFLAVLLVLGGLNLVVSEVLRRTRRQMAVSASAEVDAFAMLGSVKQATRSQAFRGGSATAVMGACDVDLRQSTLQGGEAVLDVFAFWGGVEILVPESWEVIVKGIPILAGFDDVTRPPAIPATQRLVIKGMAIMGAVEVRNWRQAEMDVRHLRQNETPRPVED